MTPKKNAVNWFELFVADLPRAKKFYETILQTQMQDCAMENSRMAMFPCDYENGVGGALTFMAGFNPGMGDTLVYLNVEGDLDGVLARTVPAGGAIVKHRFAIGEHGFIGLIQDTEGNVVGLHSMK